MNDVFSILNTLDDLPELPTPTTLDIASGNVPPDYYSLTKRKLDNLNSKSIAWAREILSDIKNNKISFNKTNSLTTNKNANANVNVNVNLKEAIKQTFNFFISKGLTPIQASGFVGNFLAESGLNPQAINKGEKKAGYKGYGRGIALWSNSRVLQFKNAIGIDPELASLELQLEFVWLEYQNRPALLKALQNATTPEEATDIVLRGYENGGPYLLATPSQFDAIYTKNKLNGNSHALTLAVRSNKALSALNIFENENS